MLYSFFIKELFNACILEFTSVVASYPFDLHFKLVLSSSCKFLKVSCTSLLSCKKNTQVKREKSSTITKQYLLPPQCLYKPLVQISPYVVTPMALSWIRHSWMDAELHVAFRLDMLHIPCLSQKSHWLVLGCAHPFEVWTSSSSQHEQPSDAKANPC